MLAILYLENNLFEKYLQKIELKTIHLLTSQFCRFNSKFYFYQSMEDKVKERTNELKESLDKVNELKKTAGCRLFSNLSIDSTFK